jgi:hypothetical protein
MQQLLLPPNEPQDGQDTTSLRILRELQPAMVNKIGWIDSAAMGIHRLMGLIEDRMKL